LRDRHNPAGPRPPPATTRPGSSGGGAPSTPLRCRLRASGSREAPG
jgi:hypothetical protein